MASPITLLANKLSSERQPSGRFAKGHIGYPGGHTHDAARARRDLNRMTIEAMTVAFKRGGMAAINKVMKNNPAMFLKMLVLLVPRELQVEHSGGVKAMTDEQIERSIEMIKAMIAERDAANAKTIDGTAREVKPRKRKIVAPLLPQPTEQSK